MMALVHVETCSMHDKANNWIKINLFCVKLNNYCLFSNDHKVVASMKSGQTFQYMHRAFLLFVNQPTKAQL